MLYRISYEKIPQKVNFQHPLFTFCPNFRTDIDGAQKFNVTLKTPLSAVTNDGLIPDHFVAKVIDG